MALAGLDRLRDLLYSNPRPFRLSRLEALVIEDALCAYAMQQARELPDSLDLLGEIQGLRYRLGVFQENDR